MKQILFLMVFIPILCFSQEWDGNTAAYDWYYNSNNNTYYISSPEDLKGFSNIINAQTMPYDDFAGKTIILKNYIELNEQKWISIGGVSDSKLYSFKGLFDGGNNFITGLNLTQQNQPISCSGLFGVNQGTIKNLHLRGVTSNFNLYPSSSSVFVGALVGTNYGTISNCDVICDIYTSEEEVPSSIVNSPGIGGITGENTGIIENSSYSGDIIGYSVYKANIGGIAGMNYGEIQQCKSNANIAIFSGELTNIGGIASNSHGIIKDCLFSGSLKSKTIWSMIGGICFRGNAENCISIGRIAENGINNILSAITFTENGAINCYYASTITNTQGAGTDVSFSKLMNKDTFVGLSQSVWNLKNGEIPSLQSTVPQYALNIKSGIQGFLSIPMHADKKTSFTIQSEDNWAIYSININGDITYVSSDTYVVHIPTYSADTNIEIVYESGVSQIQSTKDNRYKIYGSDNKIIIEGVSENTNIMIYTESGICISNNTSHSNICSIPVSTSGIYIIKIGSFVGKIAI